MNFTLDPPKRGSLKKKDFKRNPLKKGVSQRAFNTQTRNSNTRYKACGIGVECLAKNSNSC
ncbi:hypothetical protein DR8_10140 [Helicobacter pylori]